MRMSVTARFADATSFRSYDSTHEGSAQEMIMIEEPWQVGDARIQE